MPNSSQYTRSDFQKIMSHALMHTLDNLPDWHISADDVGKPNADQWMHIDVPDAQGRIVGGGICLRRATDEMGQESYFASAASFHSRHGLFPYTEEQHQQMAGETQRLIGEFTDLIGGDTHMHATAQRYYMETPLTPAQIPLLLKEVHEKLNGLATGFINGAVASDLIDPTMLDNRKRWANSPTQAGSRLEGEFLPVRSGPIGAACDRASRAAAQRTDPRVTALGEAIERTAARLQR